MKFKHHYNADLFNSDAEVNTQASLTIPDQSMSVSEIIKRFASGLPVLGEKVPIYDGEENDLPDLNHLDLADRQTLFEQYSNELQSIKSKHEREQREKERSEALKLINEQNKGVDDEVEKPPKGKKIRPYRSPEPPKGASEQEEAEG